MILTQLLVCLLECPHIHLDILTNLLLCAIPAPVDGNKRGSKLVKGVKAI